MHAAVVTEFGKDLQIQELAIPSPGPGEALDDEELLQRYWCGPFHGGHRSAVQVEAGDFLQQ